MTTKCTAFIETLLHNTQSTIKKQFITKKHNKTCSSDVPHGRSQSKFFAKKKTFHGEEGLYQNRNRLSTLPLWRSSLLGGSTRQADVPIVCPGQPTPMFMDVKP
ncbi:MAG: hypothetical protein CL920_23550 [Deltaproteobacteria bacterium]|nr:hypothetical protein [Deltaproteobacteria bacterium]MBU51677.1 hypothetical protein [Deltaproteobacteria bacterium]